MSASSITCDSVESITSGASTDSASFFTSFRTCAASSVRSVSAMHTSSVWAPPSTCSRATGISSSILSSSISRLTRREPWVFKRSPIRSGGGSC